jgi:HEAT repeat protein
MLLNLWTEFWDKVIELFTIPIVWDIYGVALLIMFILLFLTGYYLINRDIKKIKAEIFSISDYFKCIVYGLIFASAIIIIITMMIYFGINTPESSLINVLPSTGDFSIFILWPLGCLMFFLLSWPLVDFLYMAHSKENKGLTQFQEFFANKFIHRVEKPWTYLVAIGLWFGLFILPPSLISGIIKLPFIVVFASWSIALPMVILIYYAAVGYIAGFVVNYYKIPVISRAAFLAYEHRGVDGKSRFWTEFKKKPVPRLVYGMQIMLYAWMVYSFSRTLLRMFDPTNPLTSQYLEWGVFVTLMFGIFGYFTRFWRRKIKFRWMDIMFAAWLIASTGVNVLINFLMANGGNMTWTFLHWSVTEPITFFNWFPQGDNMLFVPAALIEESVLVGLITYYMLSKRTDYFRKSKYSGVETFAQGFIPVALFNLIRVKESDIRNHAKEEIIKLYGRLPYRKELDMMDPYYMDPLFDAICDYNADSQEIGIKILSDLLENYPEMISPRIISALKSYNYDKKLVIANLTLKFKEKILTYLPLNIIYDLIEDRDYQIRRIGIKLLPDLIKTTDDIKKESLLPLVNDPDSEVQADALKLISNIKIDIDPSIILDKLTNPNKRIQSSAALSIANLLDAKSLKYTTNLVDTLKQMLNNPDWNVRSSIISALGRIGDFKKNNIPIEPFLDAITDVRSEVRHAAQLPLTTYIMEMNPKEANEVFNVVLEKLNSTEDDVKINIFGIMEEVWSLNPSKIIPLLVENLKTKNKEIQKTIASVLISIGTQKPELILDSMLKVEDEVTYLKHGIISETVSKLCEKNPNILKSLMIYLTSKNETTRYNAVTSMNSAIELCQENIDINRLVTLLVSDPSMKIKKELIKLVSSLVESRPESIIGEISNILKLLDNLDNTIKLAVTRMIVPISKIAKDKIPLDLVVRLLKDSDSIIQESAIKILGNIGSVNPTKSFEILKNLLNDSNWSIRNSAMESIGILGMNVDNMDIIQKITELIDSKEKWTKLKALESMAEIFKNRPDMVLPLGKIKTLMKDPEVDVRKLVSKIIGNMKNFDDAIPLILTMMVDKDPEVRESASNALVEVSNTVEMKKLLPETLKYFSDETDMLIQQCMAVALKRILKYESKDTKKRVISILKMRSEVSQDAIISQALQELKD